VLRKLYCFCLVTLIYLAGILNKITEKLESIYPVISKLIHSVAFLFYKALEISLFEHMDEERLDRHDTVESTDSDWQTRRWKLG
jgi:hypothetical protein